MSAITTSGLMLVGRCQQGGGVGDCGAYLVALVFQQPGQPSPEQGGVLGDHDAHQRGAFMRAAVSRW